MSTKQRIGRLEFPYRAGRTPAGVAPASPNARWGANYDTAWARKPVARITRRALAEAVVLPAVTVLARPRQVGLDRLERLEGPVIFAANHHSHIDTPLLFSSIPPRWRSRLAVAAASDYFFGGAIRSATSALVIGAIPMERGKVGRRSARLAASLIEDGWSLLIFPEGGRSPDGWGQPFLGGAGYLAVRCGVHVLPVHVEGTDRILPKGHRLPRASSTTITFGDPLIPTAEENARRFAARIEVAVASLADECATNWYQARLRNHAGTTPSLTGPNVSSWRRAWALGDRSPRYHQTKHPWP
ncbi:MAG: 1-acyl-sn-glycerol-3-phosphate acyltransferase [Acidimicrobiia bacterium]|nr:1-acyl-sn-glycerol-3-phosphate acyltransferase [Acidimicrobiia bacterium]